MQLRDHCYCALLRTGAEEGRKTHCQRSTGLKKRKKKKKKVNNNNKNEYLERLTRTGPKRLHVLYNQKKKRKEKKKKKKEEEEEEKKKNKKKKKQDEEEDLLKVGISQKQRDDNTLSTTALASGVRCELQVLVRPLTVSTCPFTGSSVGTEGERERERERGEEEREEGERKEKGRGRWEGEGCQAGALCWPGSWRVGV